MTISTSISTSKLFYAYLGENATYGRPNPNTGRMTMYGDIISFSTFAKRKEFVEEWIDQRNAHAYVEACNRSSARDYCLGMSGIDFNEYMDTHVKSTVDEHYNSYFGLNS